MDQGDLRRPSRGVWLAGAVIAIYFAYFAAGALRAHFAVDDPMNLGFYWRDGFVRSMADVVLLWRKSYRPMGAAFYLPIYALFGMNPLPYRIAILAILASNIFLSYRIAMMVSASRAGAMLTAILVTAHASMAPVYYNTSMIYDVLAFFFTALMLWVYLRGGNGLLIALLYLAAINSKEVAVAGAAWVIAYEALVRKKRAWLIPAILAAITIAFLAARVFGAHALASEPGYQLELTAHRFFVNARLYLNDLFDINWFSTSRRVVIAWVVSAIACALARRRELWWAWIAASTALLPVLFTSQPRAGASLYLPMLAFALFVSMMATVWFTRWPAREWAAAAIVALLMLPTTLAWWQDRADALLAYQRLTWSVLTQLRDLPKPAHGSRILIERNPFPDWDTYFMAELVWNDHTLDINLADKLDQAPDPQRFDWVLTFDGDRLRVVKESGAVRK